MQITTDLKELRERGLLERFMFLEAMTTLPPGLKDDDILSIGENDFLFLIHHERVQR